MKRRVALVALGILSLSVLAHAQKLPTNQAPPLAPTYIDQIGGLTLDDAIARALEREPTLRATRAEIEVVRGLRVQAGLRPNPSVSFWQQQEPGGTDSQTRVEVQWPLDLSRKSGRVGVADRAVDAAQQAATDRERTLAADVRLKYGEVAAAIRTLSVTEQLLAGTARERALISSRVDAGATPPLDRDMLRVEVQRLEAERQLQAGIVDRRMIELRRLLGMPADAPLSLRESLEALVQRDRVAHPSADATQAVTTRPDVLEAEAHVRIADAQIDRAHREARPDVSLFGAYMRTDSGFPQQGFTAAGNLERVRGVFHYVSAGAMVTLPLLSRNQGSVASAEAERTGAAARLEAARLTAASEVAAAGLRDAYARRAMDAYGSDGIALARQNLDVVRQTYELGRRTLLDVFTEQRRYLDVERAYTDTLREAYEARQMLKAALGEVR